MENTQKENKVEPTTVIMTVAAIAALAGFATVMLLSMSVPLENGASVANASGLIMFTAGTFTSFILAIRYRDRALSILTTGIIISLLAGGVLGIWAQSHSKSKTGSKQVEVKNVP